MTSGPSDSELLRRYAHDGVESAFTTLVERHVAVVYGVSLRQLHDSTQAEDVTQKVFTALARRAIWLTGHPSLAGWLYRTAAHNVQPRQWGRV